MNRNTLKTLLLGATFAVFAAACSDSPTPPNMVEPEASFSHDDHPGQGFTDVSASVTTVPADAVVWTKRVTFANNLTGCSVFGIESDFGGKIDTGNPGTYTLPGSSVQVTLESLGGNTYKVSVESGYVFTDVFLKSDVENNDWYHFVPGVSSASGMTTGPAALSHFTICVNEAAEPLTAEKTAVGTYDRTVEWELEKSVDPDAHSGAPGDEFDSDWTVVATKSEESDNYKVEGTISIYNPAAVAQDFSVSDVLDDGTTATVVCPGSGNHTGTVPAGGTVVCAYTAYPADGSAEENIATVSAAGNPDVEAKAPVSFTENLIGFDEATLSDPRFGFAELISDSRTEVFPETFICPTDLSLYVDGLYSFEEVNTTYLNGNLNLEASATVTVTCEYIPECPFAALAAAQGLIYDGDCRETAWAANEDEPLSLRYTTRGNWATYVDLQGFEETGKTVNFYSAQTLLVGTVSFSAVADGMVTITIDLDPGFSYEDGSIIAVQDYAAAPSGNPAPGLFDHHFAPGEPILVPANAFYGVHAVIAGN
jgi:hypothetical protein